MELDYDFLYKILLIGDSSVGKTSVLLRYVDGFFNPEFQTTIGVDFKISTLELEGKVVKLQLWDTAGQDRFRNIVASYYRGAQGIIVMYDITNEESFKNLERWVKEIETYLPGSVPKLLVGNKSDLSSERTVPKENAEELAEKLGMSYTETSAKTSEGIKEAFYQIARDIYSSAPSKQPSNTTETTRIGDSKPVKKKWCC